MKKRNQKSLKNNINKTISKIFKSGFKTTYKPKKGKITSTKGLSKSIKKNKQGLRYSKIVRTNFSIKNLKANKPALSKDKFYKALKANVQGKINIGDFRSARAMLPDLKKAKAGKLSQKRQLELERSNWVGTYTVDKPSSNKRAYTLSKIYTKKGLNKIFPNAELQDEDFKFIQRHLGYSKRSINQLKERQIHMKDSLITDPKELNDQLRHIHNTLGSWSGSSKFDTIIERMGGFTPAITKYLDEVETAAKRYGIPLDDIIREYAPWFMPT